MERAGSTAVNIFDALAFQATPTAATAVAPRTRNCPNPRRDTRIANPPTRAHSDGALLRDNHFHLHAVVELAADHGAFNKVFTRLGGSSKGKILRAFLQAKVPTLVLQGVDGEAVHCAVFVPHRSLHRS